MTNAIRIQPGFPDYLRAEAGALFFDAFSDKLGGFLGHDARSARLMGRLILPEDTICALSGDDKHLLGLAGLKRDGKGFLSGTLSDMAAEYGVFGGLWRGLLLELLDHKGEPGCLHIDALAVTRTARGQSIGTQLLDACRDEAGKLGLTKLSLDVVDTNPRARALYERYGFREVRRQYIGPLRYVFGFHAAIRMICDLPIADTPPADKPARQ